MENAPSIIRPPSTPSVNIIGCGGAGINMLRHVVSAVTGRATHRYIDTSYSNLKAGEEVIIINGDGSGGLRKENAPLVNQKLSGYTGEQLNLADINIIVFSLSGGSGSVLGPLLIKEISRRKKLTVAIVIASSEDQIHTENTLNTLKSLESITAADNIYLPIMIFNNAYGRQVVNKHLPFKLERLVDLLTLPAIEIDKNDRLHWINVPKISGAAGGLRLLYVGAERTGSDVDRDGEEWSGTDGYIFDSVIHLSTDKEVHSLSTLIDTRMTFAGTFTTVQNVPMIGVIGNPPNAFDKLTSAINDTLQKYKSQSVKKVAAVTIAPDDIDDETGLVL